MSDADFEGILGMAIPVYPSDLNDNERVGAAGAVDPADGSHGALPFALLGSSKVVGEEQTSRSGRF